MTGNATFGDFWARSAASLIQGQGQPDAADRPAEAAAVAAALRRLLTVITRYLDDEVRWLNPEGLGPWSRALVQSRIAVQHAVAILAECPAAGREPPGGEGATARDLSDAAGTLQLARDLLQTHFTAGPRGSRTDRSDWAPVIASPQVSRALLGVLAAQARAAAARVSALLLPDGIADPPGRAALRRANPWLNAFDSAVRSAHFLDPVPDADLHLLEAVPVNAVAGRQAPTGAEQTAELAAGLISVAERVQRGARELAGRARWDPGMNAASMRQTAGACVVTSDSCEVILRSLADRAGELGQPELRDFLGQVAARAAAARRSWLAAARGWDQMATDAPGRMTPFAADALGMALWTGRLAYADPSWTPARGPSQQLRQPGSLAPDEAGLGTVIAAVHYASAAVMRLGEAGEQQIRVAAAAGRLYVPTRSLPEDYDVPRRMAKAPQSRVDTVLQAYSLAAEASVTSTLAVAAAAEVTGAPSRVLSAAARAAGNTRGGPLPQGLVMRLLMQQPDMQLIARANAGYGLRGLTASWLPGRDALPGPPLPARAADRGTGLEPQM
jgi:hypothetical protein